MAVTDLIADTLPTATVPWRVTVEPPRGKKKTWYMRARRTVAGKRQDERVSTGCETEAEARIEAARWGSQKNGTAVVEDPTVLAIYDAHVTAMTIHDEAKLGTLNNYATARAALIADTTLMPMLVSAVSRKHLLAAQTALRSTGPKGQRAPRTVNGWLDFVRAAWHRALTHEQITKPWPQVDPLDCTEPTIPKRAYEVEEIDAVLTDMRINDPYWYPVFQLVAVTSARIGEIVSRRAKDVLTGTIMVRTTKTGMPKEVGVPEAVMALVPGREPDAYLFPMSRDKSQHVLASSALKALRRSLDRLKIADADWLDVHSFRRAWCADSEDAGVARNQAMAQSGHRSGKIFDLYASKARSRKRETAEKVQAHRRERLGGRDPGMPGDNDQGQGALLSPVEPSDLSPLLSPAGSGASAKLKAHNGAQNGRGMGARARPTDQSDRSPRCRARTRAPTTRANVLHSGCPDIDECAPDRARRLM